MITITQKGSFDSLTKYLDEHKKIDIINRLKPYAQSGVNALKEHTPKDSGLTANSWNYEIIPDKKGVSIIWTNSNIVNNFSVAMLIQYGHASKNGTFISGIDYINPALEPIMKSLSDEIWKEVNN